LLEAEYAFGTSARPKGNGWSFAVKKGEALKRRREGGKNITQKNYRTGPGLIRPPSHTKDKGNKLRKKGQRGNIARV